MPSEPIPIGRSPPSQSGMPSSGSPTQPWAGSAVGLSTSTPGSLFGKWNAFSSVTKSPTNSTSVRVNPVNAGDSPPTASTTHSQQLDIPHHEDDHFDHDSLEFGDLADLKNRGWAAAAAARGQRRAVSMSLSPTTPLQNQANGGAIATSPNFGVLTDKMARGNGVLRRLSLSSGFTKPPPVGSHVPSPPNPTPIDSTLSHMAPPGLAVHPPADQTVPRHGAAANGRRRFSESGARKRGVSPMGERLLRDQVHF